MSNLVNKISFKTVAGNVEMTNVKFTDADGNDKQALRAIEKLYMRLVGVIRGHEVVSSQYGDSVAFTGEIRAINLITGEVYNGPKLFLPAVAESFVYNAFLCAELQEGFNGLEIAFDLGVKPHSGPMGYEYMVKPLLEQSHTDRLAELLLSLPPALEAPKQVKYPKKGEA